VQVKGYVSHRLRYYQKIQLPLPKEGFFDTIRQRQVSQPCGEWIFIEQSAHKPVNLFLSYSYTRQKECQNGIIIALVFQRQDGKLTIGNVGL
jgi:hypothetical protein